MPPFTFQIDGVCTCDQLTTFAFELVLAAAWLRYRAQIDGERVAGAERGVETLGLDREARRRCVQAAFDEALEKLSADNPFRDPIRRYVAEVALPFVDDDEPAATPRLQLVR
jgi:hypothetical protein